MTATVTVGGTVTLDDALEARFSNLTSTGDGAMGTMAAGFLRPHIDRLAARAHPLAAWLPSPLQLRDVSISAGDTVRIAATVST